MQPLRKHIHIILYYSHIPTEAIGCSVFKLSKPKYLAIARPHSIFLIKKTSEKLTLIMQ